MRNCKCLCVPSDDENILTKLKSMPLQKEEKRPKCECKNIIKSFKAGSFKNNISLVKLKKNNRIIVVFKKKKFDNKNIHDIMKETQIQKKVHDEAGSQYAPDVYRLDYYSTGKGEEIFLMTGYAGDNGYKQLQDTEKIVNFMEVYPCVDNSFNGELYYYFTLALPVYKKLLNEEEEEDLRSRRRIRKEEEEEEEQLDEDDIKLCKYYATLFNPANYKNCLEQWYMRCEHFFVPFFRDLHELHKIDVFHHDLRSDNIWYKKDNTGYHFKFIDFGISTSLEDSLILNLPNVSFGSSTLVRTDKTSQKELIIDFSEKETIQDRKDTIMNEMKSDEFSEQTLKDLMMVEMTSPQTLPLSEQDIDKYREFTFFNEDIFNNFIDVFDMQMINKFQNTRTEEQRKEERKKPTKDRNIDARNMFRFIFKYKSKVINTFTEFIAEKYSETIMNQYKN